MYDLTTNFGFWNYKYWLLILFDKVKKTGSLFNFSLLLILKIPVKPTVVLIQTCLLWGTSKETLKSTP